VKVVPPEEPKQAPANPNRAYVEVLRPPVHILKRPDPAMAGLMPMDVDPRASSHERRKESEISKTKEHLGSIKTKLNPNDIRIQDPTGKPAVKEKSGLAYKFALELQQ